jgi:hypothetical protein
MEFRLYSGFIDFHSEVMTGLFVSSVWKGNISDHLKCRG